MNLDGLNNLIKINEHLHIHWNPSLVNLHSFINLETLLGHLSISYNSSLEKIDGFAQLHTIESDLYINGNNALENLSGLINLDSIHQRCHIDQNPSLKHFNGLSNLSYIGGQLDIIGNDQLENINALSNLSFVGSVIAITDNQTLNSIDGLIGLTATSNSLLVNSNPNLSNIDGLINIENIGFSLVIEENENLENLDGLASLTTIFIGLQIRNNNSLTNLDGLSNLNSIGNNLNISNNPNLVNCCGIHHLLTVPNFGIYIADNPSNCSSETEIIEKICGIAISSNPPCLNANNGSIQIQTFTDAPPFQFFWENTTNQQTGNGNFNNNNFTIPNLAEGTYNLTVTDNDGNEFIEENLLLSSIPGSIFEIIEITTTNSSNGFNNGAIHLIVAGGFTPYTYQWSGMSTGSQDGVDSLNFSIQNQEAGEYDITVTDDNGGQQTVSLTLLDETVPIFPCTQPLDIVILNDVSGSVDGIEYMESKQFFVNFLEAANIGTGADDSRAAIIEWSNASSQSVQIPMTDDLSTLQGYVNNNRAFSGGTVPHSAMIFGENYLASVARPNVARVLILSTDGSSGQISPSLIELADQFKAQGYHIMTVAFDGAFSNITTREILQEVASINLLAPGAPAYQ